MKKFNWTLLLGAVVLAVVSSSFADERIDVPCEEHKRVTGQDVCRSLTTVKWDRDEWEALKAATEAWIAERTCKEAVWRKYAAYGKYGIERFDDYWDQDMKPRDVAEKDWVSCHAPQIWSGTESFACYEELQACEVQPPAPPAAPPKEQIKLWE